MIRTRAGRIASLVALVGPLAVGPAATSSARPVASEPDVTTAAPDPDARLAFTDEPDALYRLTVERDEEDGDEVNSSAGPPTSYPVDAPAPPGTAHEGEAGGSPGSPPVFVSTRDDPAGEIYAVTSTGDAERVTCEPGTTETHPVVNPDTGQIAYASNAEDGDWDIYVATPPGPVVMRPAPGRATSGSRARTDTCSDGTYGDWTTVNLTEGADLDDDRWPTWIDLVTGTSPVAASQWGLAFSRSSPGELPDLFTAEHDAEGDEWLEPVVLGEPTPDIVETQPAAMQFTLPVEGECEPGDEPCPALHEAQSWIAFSTSRYGGSIAAVSPDDPGASTRLVPSRVVGEAAWSSPTNPTHLAFTTRDDPYGSLGVARVEAPTAVAGEGISTPDVEEYNRLDVAISGTGESHPFWLDGFGPDDQAFIVHTGRANPRVADGSRVLDADIGDVLAIDGTDRHTIRDQSETYADGAVQHRYDEAGPSYSPDGSRIVYSHDTDSAAGATGARVLMVADTDGADAGPLLPPSQRAPSDVDLDPAWSPDGSRIAFVRIRDTEAPERPPPEIWVYDLASEVATRIPGTVDGADLSPSWAPDSRHLVVARSDDGLDGMQDSARRWGHPHVATASTAPGLVVLDADDPAAPGVELFVCGEGCIGALGRTPAWSPDGSQIVYADDGRLELLTFADDRCCEFDHDTGIAEPTGTETAVGSTVSWADDPARAPDGSEIAFAGQQVGQPDQRDIWTVSPDGTGLRQVTDGRGPETEPACQPSPVSDLEMSVAVAGSPAEPGESVAATFTVTNHGPDPAFDVDLVTGFGAGADLTAVAPPAGCETDGGGCAVAALQPDAQLTYEVAIGHPSPVNALATASASTTSEDPVPTNNADQAPYVIGDVRDVGVTVELDEPVGYVGGIRTATVTVPNLGGEPAEDVTLSASWPDLVLPASPDGSETPTCLPDGEVCDLGDGPVAIPPAAVTVAEDGTIRTSVYLIRRSRVGQREWTATSATDAFSPVQTELLMVLRQLRPPNFAGRG